VINVLIALAVIAVFALGLRHALAQPPEQKK
jgi:hypothetical protein